MGEETVANDDGSDSKGPCQICLKVGHTAAECWHRFKKNFVPHPNRRRETRGAYVASTDGQSSGAWYLDSGATNHVTNALRKISMNSEYQGNGQLAVGNVSESIRSISDPVSMLSFSSNGNVSVSVNEYSVVDKSGGSISKAVEEIDLWHLRLGHPNTDMGGEFRIFEPYLKREGITLRHSCPYLHEQNGKIERKHKHIVETGLTLLTQAKMPLKYWQEAFTHAVFIINRLVSPVIGNKTPFELVYSLKPDSSQVKVFGSSVKFNENSFPFSNDSNFNKKESVSERDFNTLSERFQVMSFPVNNLHNLTQPAATYSHSQDTARIMEHTPNLVQDEAQQTLDTESLISPTLSSLPNNTPEALKKPKWKRAIEDEYNALMKNKTWTLIPNSQNYKLVGNKWVYRVKENSDGTINKFKTRLVAKGFLQTPGVDFKETFSPIVKAATIRIVLTVVVNNDWKLRQVDINNAFLNGDLTETVYMPQPEGFEDKNKPNHICKLNKALYGLRQAPRAWFDKLKSVLYSWDFENSKCDTSLFFRRTKSDIIIMLIYVDDIIITRSNCQDVEEVVVKLSKTFSLKDLGDLNFFLGIQLARIYDTILLSQTKYV
ncbi:hypothetical protein WN943_006274 [Citrus x changshan-huyou]